MDYYKVVKNICFILDMDELFDKISIERVDVLGTKTQLAAVNIAKNRIYLKKNPKCEMDLIFAIAHEIRHLWQQKNGWAVNKAVPPWLSSSYSSYNLQDREIDANAFAVVYISQVYQLAVQVNDWPVDEAVKAAIFRRVEEIAHEFE